MGDEDQRAKRNRIEMELVKGKQIAIRLQTLLRNPVREAEPVPYEELALQILRSFTTTLSELSSCSKLPESNQIATGDGNGSTCSIESMKKPAVKDRRGCYKRRKTSDSHITISRTIEDGHAWRKYGQKEILNSVYPRLYYRCTHKQQGCKAIKQVQKFKEDPFYYQTTYINHHTCTDTIGTSHHIVDSDPVDPNLLSFQQMGTILSTPTTHIIPPVKQDSLVMKHEYKEDGDGDGDGDGDDKAKSSLDPWHDILVGSDSDFWFGYKPLWGPTMMGSHQEAGSGFQTFGSSSLS